VIPPTPHCEVNALLEELLRGIRGVLGERLVGVYLYGSLVTGGFDPSLSDIDLLAATSADDAVEELHALREMHAALELRHPGWEGRIEVQYLSAAGLRTFRQRRARMVLICPGEPLHRTDAGADWLMNWYLVRELGVALAGPPPSALIDPISKEEFVAAVRAHALNCDQWLANARSRKAQAYVILTMCRTLVASEGGQLVSKLEAARWTAKALPEWAALAGAAVEWRAAESDSAVDHGATYPETVRFVRAVQARLAV
jgi:hypothetical protein